jgi:hypothetical protein
MEANGRVDILGPDLPTLFAMSDRIPINKCTSFRDAMAGNWYDTQLSAAFFSKENIIILQNGIRAGVYKKSNGQYLVGLQSCDELKIVMRGVFLQNSKNLPSNISQQISALNAIVLDYCIKQVYGEAEGYMKYKRDASTLVVPMSNPILSKINDKQLFLKNFF